MKIHFALLTALAAVSLSACADDGRYQDRSSGYEQSSAQQRQTNTAYQNSERDFSRTQTK